MCVIETNPVGNIVSTLCRVIFAVTSIIGCYGIGYSMSMDGLSRDSVDIEVDWLLERHDLCGKGYLRADSAGAYTVAALELIDKKYGFDSKEYVYTFTDYMISDLAKNREALCETVYPLVMDYFDPTTDYVWYCYFTLGKKLLDLEEYDKAINLFDKTENAATEPYDRLNGRIYGIIARQHRDGGNLEQMLETVGPEVKEIELADRANLLYPMALNIARYYLNVSDHDNALKFIDFGEHLNGWISNRKMRKLLELKYDILAEQGNPECIRCLDRITELSETDDEDDIKWLASAYVDRGDHALNQEFNVDDAVKYYIKAYKLISGPYAYSSPVMQAITRRMMHLLTMSGDHDDAIEMGRVLIDAEKRMPSGVDLHHVLELVDALLNAGRPDEAGELLDSYSNEFEKDNLIRQKYLIHLANLKLKLNDNASALEILDRIGHEPLRRDLRLWHERYSALACARQGDARASAFSDSISKTAKKNIMKQMLMISPAQRGNWLALCHEAIEWQLSLGNCATAIANAAELNLYRKGLLLRTSTQIRDRIKSEPSNAKTLAMIDSLQALLNKSRIRGDSSSIHLSERIDSLEQIIAYRSSLTDNFTDKIDIDLKDVISRLGKNDAAIDFYYRKMHGKFNLGAFVYYSNRQPFFIQLAQHDGGLQKDDIFPALSKLEQYTAGHDNVYFCADGILNTTGFEFYNHPAVTGRNWHRVFHLADIHEKTTMGSRPVLIGVSDHNSPIGDGETIDRGTWTDLPDVKHEIQQIANRLEHLKPMVLFNDNATEEDVKRLSGTHVTTLHITTHGFYRNNDQLNNAAKDTTDHDHNIALRLLSSGLKSISGLVLRGGNISWQAKQISDDEDNLLTEQEIERMSFPDLRLTVLSACDTGLGEIDSEGVWGLQRAFRIAGTQSLICTLSKVDEYWTAQFMDEFYEQASKGKTIYDSFHTAQKWLKRELPDNPEIWSSFILIE